MSKAKFGDLAWFWNSESPFPAIQIFSSVLSTPSGNKYLSSDGRVWESFCLLEDGVPPTFPYLVSALSSREAGVSADDNELRVGSAYWIWTEDTERNGTMPMALFYCGDGKFDRETNPRCANPQKIGMKFKHLNVSLGLPQYAKALIFNGQK